MSGSDRRDLEKSGDATPSTPSIDQGGTSTMNDSRKASPSSEIRPTQPGDDQPKSQDPATLHTLDPKLYTVFTPSEIRTILFLAGLCSFFSPISSQIYFPSLNAIASDLHVSDSLINLTMTSYLIMQGLSPAFTGALSDSSGRRPTYFICFLIYSAANLGLALQSDYAALITLRCVQAAGGAGTVALGNAVVADLVTSQERGRYVSYMSVAPQAGPSLGPVIGGLLGEYLGWHAGFWFLLIATGVVVVPVGLFLPETCRVVVGDGSVPPPRGSWCLMNGRVERRLKTEGKGRDEEMVEEVRRGRKRGWRVPNPIGTVKIVFTKEAGYALAYIGLVCCSYYATIALIPSQFGRIYGFNELQIALCYIPLGCGSLLASFVRGRIIDSRYKFHAKRLGLPLEFNRKVDLSNFPIERARLEVAIPTLAFGSASMIGFGWMVQAKVNLSGPLVFLFIIGFCISASLNTVSVLLVDLYPGKAGTATAANNMVRCWLGAGATSGVVPLINKIGIGWTTTFFAFLMIGFSPILWYIMQNGPQWRRQTKERKLRQEAEKQSKNDGGEKGATEVK